MIQHNKVEARRFDGVAVVMIDNPPVNVLGLALRSQLYDTIMSLADDPSVKGVVIACRGKTFVAGADISEFGTAKQKASPLLPALCDQIETMSVPVVAAIHGVALGGGLELALACHHRVIRPGTSLGLPEVTFGFIPGSGGTVRLPRLIGPHAALDMMVTGAPISSEKAIELGLADHLATGDLIEEAVAFLNARIRDDTYVLQPLRSRGELLEVTRQDMLAFEDHANRLLAKTKGLCAPAACVDALRNALTLPFDEALRKERERFLEMSASPESKALRHLFFAEREAVKVTGIGKDVLPRAISTIGVIGAGTMGGGIAMAFANAGYPVTVLERTEEELRRGFGLIERNYAASVSRGSLTEAARTERKARLTGTTNYDALAGCDLIVEAVFEDMDIKKEVFARLGTVAKPGAILATNTSYLDVNEITAASGRPSNALGLHFFSPANVMRLLEIVRGTETAPDVVASAVSIAKKIGKLPVIVGVGQGFVGNRMLVARSAENENLLLGGATPAQVDKAFTDFGWPMGPFQMGDLAGLDIGWRNRKALGKSAVLADSLCARGHFGQKTSRGWYRYEPGSRTPLPDPEVQRLIEETASRLGISRRTIPSDEIIERTLLPMIDEGRKLLDEGIAARTSDIDLVWVYGYGFPKSKGGPMFWAEHRSDFDREGNSAPDAKAASRTT